MRSPARSLGCLLLLCGACAEIIGLNDYDKVGDGEGGGAGASAKGGSAGSGAKGGRAATGGEAGMSGGGDTAGEGGRDAAGEGGGGAGGAGAGGMPQGGAGADGGGSNEPRCKVNQELLLNPSFDDATTDPWEQGSTERRTEILSADDMPPGLTPKSAPRSAVLGGTGTYYKDIYNDDDVITPGGDAFVRQRVVIPLGTKTITLSCYYRILTDETEPLESDGLSAWLWDTELDQAAVLFNIWYNTSEINSWQQLSYSADVTELAGNSYDMEFFALYDFSLNTWFAVDNCSLRTTACY